MKTISEKIVRQWVQSVLENSPLGVEPVGPVDVNPVVDPEAPQTDPFDTNFSPQNKAEFDVAIRDLVRDLPDDQMPVVYDKVKDAVAAQAATAADDEQRRKAERSGTLMQSKSGVNVEEAVRTAVRKLIEINAVVGDRVRDQSTGRSGRVTRVGSNAVAVERDPQTTKKSGWFSRSAPASKDSGEVVLRRDEFEDHYVKEGVTETDDDDDGNNGDEMEWKEMAQKLGHGDKVHGVRHEFGRAVTKMRFLAGMDPDDREVMILDAMNDYIKHLASSGELPPSDVQLLHDHPDMVRELPGFLEFLHDYVKSEMRGKKVEIPEEGVIREAGLPKWVDLSFFKHIRTAVQKLLPGEKTTFDISDSDPEYIQYVIKHFEGKGFSTYVSSGKLVVQKKPDPKKAEPISYPHTFGHPEWFDQLYHDDSEG